VKRLFAACAGGLTALMLSVLTLLETPDCWAAGPGAVEAPKAGDRTALVVMDDGTAFRGEVLRATEGFLQVDCHDGHRNVPLNGVTSIDFDPNRPAVAASPPPPLPRVGLLQIELSESVADARRRLDRIGADYAVIPPEAALERLAEFDVLYVPHGWAALRGGWGR
jgi:hypothetical protein